jgi:hypothetical protein
MKLLRVSPSTVDRLQKQIWSGNYNQIIHYWEDKNNRTSVLNIIDSLLTVGGVLPRYNYNPKKWVPYKDWSQNNKGINTK